MASTWDRKRAAHLYRRAGFGASPAELDHATALGREGAVSLLVDFDAISTDALDSWLDLFGFDPGSQVDLVRWWYFRMQYTPRPLEEKLTLFWHNHFATSIEKVGSVPMMYAQNQIFRSLGMGKFGDLLLAVSRDPAMLIWLDNASNVKQAPNENFAREVMELFTLGLGNYTQQDVTEAARAFTGWTIDAANGDRFLFDPTVHDDGLKAFLGSFGYYRGEDIIAILAARPETAAFVTAKLARSFLGSDPSPGLQQTLTASFLANGGDLREIVRAILLSDDFDATADQPDMLKSPVEIIVAARKSMGAYDDPENYAMWPAMMGQEVFTPPNVGGWKGGRFWMNTGSYLVRIRIAFSIVTQPARNADTFRWDISRFFEDRQFESADDVIDFIADRFNLVYVSDPLRASLRTYLGLSGQPFRWSPASYVDYARGAIYLVMASPEYQLQ